MLLNLEKLLICLFLWGCFPSYIHLGNECMNFKLHDLISEMDMNHMVWILTDVCQFNLRENQGSIRKNLTASLPFCCFLPILNVWLFPLLYSIKKLKMEKSMSDSIFYCEPKHAFVCFS